MMAMSSRARLLLSIGVVAFAAAGCGGEQEELTQWMDQQQREVKPSVQPLSPPKKFIPQAYVSLTGVEPFSSQKLSVALKQEARQPNSLLAAEINRRKEPLEAYPLDSMSMVGSVSQVGPPLRLAAGRQPALPGEAGRLPRAELRKDHQDLRDRVVAQGNCSGCSGRMD